jgi:hypothetical protein
MFFTTIATITIFSIAIITVGSSQPAERCQRIVVELGDDVDPLIITSIISADEMLKEGLLLAGFSLKKQERQPKSNLQDFKDRYGSSPIVLCCI